MKKLALNTSLYIFLTVVALLVVVPFLFIISTSLKSSGEVFVFPPKLIPEEWIWGNFKAAWTFAPFNRYFFNSALVATCVVVGTLLTSSLSAYSFARLKYPGRDIIFITYLATLMIPFQVIMIPNFILMKNFGWLNHYEALIYPAMFTAYGTFLLRQFFITIPKEIEEAAIIDGCGHLRIYLVVMLPLAKPALSALVIITFLHSWNSFLWPLIVISNKAMYTLPLGLSLFKGQYVTELNMLMAATLITITPVLVIYLAAQKYFIEGITLSGIKG